MSKKAVPGIIILMILLLFCGTAVADSSGYFPAGGTGTGDDPYRIHSLDDLLNLSYVILQESGYSTAHYQLMEENIDLGGDAALSPLAETYNADHNWIPIGDYKHAFNGIFTGGKTGSGPDMKSISNINVRRSSDKFQGLFGYVARDAVISGISLSITEVSGLDYVGGIAGYSTGTISDFSVTAHKISGRASVGGVTGVNFGDIRDGILAANITGTEYIGGVAGESPGTITQTDSVVELSGVTYVGGIAGKNTGNITLCSTEGQIRGSENVDAIAGDTTAGTVTESTTQAVVTIADPPVAPSPTQAPLPLVGVLIGLGSAVLYLKKAGIKTRLRR